MSECCFLIDTNYLSHACNIVLLFLAALEVHPPSSWLRYFTLAPCVDTNSSLCPQHWRYTPQSCIVYISFWPPCVIHTPPLMAPLVHPSKVHNLRVNLAPWVIDSPSILIPLVTSFEAASFPHCAMRDTHSSLLNSIVGTSLMAAPSSIFLRHHNV